MARIAGRPFGSPLGTAPHACHCTGECVRTGRCGIGPGGIIGPSRTPTPAQPLPLGKTYREPLTEDDVRRIFREEIERARQASSAGLFESTEAS